jgi:helicase
MKTHDISQETDDSTINLAIDTIKKNKQALVFVNTKRSAEKQAEDIAKQIKTQSNDLNNLSEEIVGGLSKPTKQCERLAKCIKKGIAFHHAGLLHFQREIIEDGFKSGMVKIICCTPTLAAGVDLPAFRTIIKDLKRYAGKFGMSYIPVLEYMQMAGRAGRPKYDKFGESICIAKSESEKKSIIDKYLNGYPEDIFSKLAVEPVLRFYLLSLIATEFVNSKKDIMDFFSKTFWAYQFKDMDELEKKVMSMLQLLEDWEFLKSSGTGDFVSAAKMEESSYKSTIIGKRVAELYIDPLTAHNLMIALQTAKSKKVLNSFSFLQIVSHTLEMRPLLSVRVREWDEVQQKSAQYEPYLLESEPSVYEPEHEEFMQSVKTALMMQDWIDEKDEEYLMETYNIRPGETRVKINLGDWMLYCMDELARIMHFQDIIKEIRKTRFRLKYGVKEELLPLLKLEGIGRMRARKLFRNKLKTVSDIKKFDIGKLAQIIGKRTAISVKEQVGEKVEKEKIKIPKGRRKGQVSLKKFQFFSSEPRKP